LSRSSAWPRSRVGTTGAGHTACTARIASSIFSSVAASSPYPVFTSAAPVPVARISASRSARREASASRGAARTAATVDRMPPPAFRMSRYDAPARFISHSCQRSPAQQACVWQSTSAGITTRPRASIRIDTAREAAGPSPTADTMPRSTTTCPRSMTRSARIASPRSGPPPAGGTHVTMRAFSIAIDPSTMA
jgi:hypothetical protein